MDRSTMQHPVLLALIFGLAVGAVNTAMAASKLGSLAVAPSTNSAELMDVASLEDLVARVALYPDELLAVVLPASTFPLQIVQAARYLEAHKSDPNLEPNSAWDESIVALLNYPEVITLLNTDLDWTWQLGEAVIKQQSDVIVAIERFRERAYAAGNLKSDDHKVVKREHNAVAITSADPDAVYVPYYEPDQIVYQQSVTPYYYYPTRYPLYYYPYSPGHAFHSRAFWGITTAFTIGWFTKHLHYHPYGYRSHPFYGHRYHRSNFRRHGLHAGRRHINSRHRHKRNYHGDYWNGNNRLGHRPRHLRHSRAYPNTGFGGHHGRSNAPLRAANGLLGNGTNHHRRSANHHNRLRDRHQGQATAIPRAANGLIGNGVSNRTGGLNHGNRFRGRQQSQATTIPRAANGLIGNGVSHRRSVPDRRSTARTLRRGTASTSPRASNGFIGNRSPRANSARANGGPRQATRSNQRSGANRSQAAGRGRGMVADRGPIPAAQRNPIRQPTRASSQRRPAARSTNSQAILAFNNLRGGTVADRGPTPTAARRNAIRQPTRASSQRRPAARSTNSQAILAYNNLRGGSRATAVDSRRATSARSSNRAAFAPRANAKRSNRSSGQPRTRSSSTTNRAMGNRSGRGSRSGAAGFGRSALRAR